MAKTQHTKVTTHAHAHKATEAEAPRGREIVISDQLQADYNELKEQGQNKSTTIRALSAKGYARGQIAKVMNIRYQHVRNVMITPVKRPVVKEPIDA
jgi:predicted GTPase